MKKKKKKHTGTRRLEKLHNRISISSEREIIIIIHFPLSLSSMSYNTDGKLNSSSIRTLLNMRLKETKNMVSMDRFSSIYKWSLKQASGYIYILVYTLNSASLT